MLSCCCIYTLIHLSIFDSVINNKFKDVPSLRHIHRPAGDLSIYSRPVADEVSFFTLSMNHVPIMCQSGRKVLSNTNPSAPRWGKGSPNASRTRPPPFLCSPPRAIKAAFPTVQHRQSRRFRHSQASCHQHHLESSLVSPRSSIPAPSSIRNKLFTLLFVMAILNIRLTLIARESASYIRHQATPWVQKNSLRTLSDR